MEQQQYQLRKKDQINTIKCYTLDLDWTILKNPLIDKKRYDDYLRFLNKNDIKSIQQYMKINGCDAEIQFKSISAFKLKYNGIISLQEKTAPIKLEENDDLGKQRLKVKKIKKSKMKYIRQNNDRNQQQFEDIIVKVEKNQLIDETLSVKDQILQELAKQYHIDQKQLQIIKQSVSNDYHDLIECLKGNSEIQWSPFEDEILKNISLDEIEYKQLVRYKGEASVQKRLQFLKQN